MTSTKSVQAITMRQTTWTQSKGVGGGGELISPFNIFIESLKIRLKKKKKKKKHEELLAIYGIAIAFYRTFTSLLNIQFIRKSYGSELG